MDTRQLIRFLFACCLLLAVANAWATEYTSTQAGNWSTDATWGGGGHPVDGDTAIIRHAVAVDANATVGASGAAGSVAIAVDHSGSYVGALTINAGNVLIVRGDITVASATITLAAGATLTFDSSLASGTPIYKLSHSASVNNNRLICNGTSGSRCTLNIAAGSGVAKMTDSLGYKTSAIHLAYTDVISWGSASVHAFEADVNSSPNEFYLDHCTFTSCGRIWLYYNIASTPLTITYNRWISAADTILFVIANHDSTATAARNFTDNMCASETANWSVLFGSGQAGWNIQRNIFNSLNATGTNATNVLGTVSGNLFYNRASNWSCVGIGGDTISNSYVFLDAVGSGKYGLLELDAQTVDGTILFDGLIYDCASPVVDPFQIMHTVTSTAPTKTTTELRHAISLPMPDGTGPGGFYGRDLTKTSAKVNHCTLMVANRTSLLTRNCAVNAGDATGFWDYCKNNLVWAKSVPSLGYGLIAGGDSGGPTNADTFTVLDYNAAYNLNTATVYDASGANGVSKLGYGAVTGTYFRQTTQSAVGAHDIDLGTGSNEMTSGPKFVDSSRNLATFDTAATGLNHAAGTAWADSHSYSIGDVCSSQSSGFYANAVINFRCIKAHTSASEDATNGQPGGTTATAYRTNWEFNSAYLIRQDTSLIATLYTWVSNGFKVQNADLNNAGSDGVTIGAMGYQAPASGHGHLLLGQRKTKNLDSKKRNVTWTLAN